MAGDVSDFPVLITLNVDAELASQALANGDDIVFTAADGATQLAHEIEYFDEATGTLRAWVKTDLSASVDTAIYMYYGNAAATNQENAAGVWGSNYVGVYHLDESPTGVAGELVDSSGNGNHAATQGAMDASDSVVTAMGQGLAFDGANDMLRIPDSSSLDGLNDAATFSLWINFVDAADGDHQIVMSSANRFSEGDGYEWASQGDGDHFFYPDATSPDGNYNLGLNPFTNGQWHHLAATMDYATKEVKIYVDGTPMTFSYEGVPGRWTDLTSSGDLLWGGNPDRASRFFQGMMDEIRLADVVRSQEWIQTEVNNQTNPGAFLTVGTAELPLSQHSLTDIDEDDFTPAGNSVLSIINSVGGDRITDDDDGAVEGIAVIGVDDTNGQWQYDANADGTWVAFGSVSDSSAVLLDTGALVRFVPDPNYNGNAGSVTFRAWDQTSGSNGDTAVDASTNGDDSAFSCKTATATLNVNPVNDAPSDITPDSFNIDENTDTTGGHSLGSLSATDQDTGETFSYSIQPGGDGALFSIGGAGSNELILDDGVLDFETKPSYTVNVRVTDSGGLTYDETLTVNVNDINESSVTGISDTDAAADFVLENSTPGTVVGVTAFADDADGTDTVSYSLDDDAGGRFTIEANTGVVTVAGGIDREAAASYDITVRATSSDTSSTTQSFTIAINDVDEFDVTAISDSNAAANAVNENAANGTVVGVTAFASDADATTNTITYSLDDNAGGRFAIDANTGVVTVADGSLLDREAAASPRHHGAGHQCRRVVPVSRASRLPSTTSMSSMSRPSATRMPRPTP